MLCERPDYLVERVELQGPFDELKPREGEEFARVFVDTPGLADPNPAARKTTYTYLRGADCVLYLLPDGGELDSDAEVMIRELFKRDRQGGAINNLILVLPKLDRIAVDAKRENRSLEEYLAGQQERIRSSLSGILSSSLKNETNPEQKIKETLANTSIVPVCALGMEDLSEVIDRFQRIKSSGDLDQILAFSQEHQEELHLAKDFGTPEQNGLLDLRAAIDHCLAINTRHKNILERLSENREKNAEEALQRLRLQQTQLEEGEAELERKLKDLERLKDSLPKLQDRLDDLLASALKERNEQALNARREFEKSIAETSEKIVKEGFGAENIHSVFPGHFKTLSAIAKNIDFIGSTQSMSLEDQFVEEISYHVSVHEPLRTFLKEIESATKHCVQESSKGMVEAAQEELRSLELETAGVGDVAGQVKSRGKVLTAEFNSIASQRADDFYESCHQTLANLITPLIEKWCNKNKDESGTGMKARMLQSAVEIFGAYTASEVKSKLLAESNVENYDAELIQALGRFQGEIRDQISHTVQHQIRAAEKMLKAKNTVTREQLDALKAQLTQWVESVRALV